MPKICLALFANVLVWFFLVTFLPLLCHIMAKMGD